MLQIKLLAFSKLEFICIYQQRISRETRASLHQLRIRNCKLPSYH